jgi:polyisoprenoid-binding protein YceI
MVALASIFDNAEPQEAHMSTANAATTAIAAGTWNVDPAHSKVGFAVRHMGIASVRGEFTQFAGTLEIGDGGQYRIRGTASTASIDTNEPQRDAHLRSADFFDAERYPEIGFEATRVEPLDEHSLAITGNLTMHGTTVEITLRAEVGGTGIDPYGNERVGLEVTGELSRGDFGMRFNQALGSGNMLVSDRVRLVLDIQAIRQPH